MTDQKAEEPAAQDTLYPCCANGAERIAKAIETGSRLIAAAILSTDAGATKRMMPMMVLVEKLTTEKTDA